MKKVCLTLVCGLLVIGLGGSAFARPAFKTAFDEQYGSVEGVKKASEELKCGLCHFGKDKKNRNDYGRALSEFMNKELSDLAKSDPAAAKKTFQDGFKKTEEKKATDGTTFGERLKAGKAPGTPQE